MGSEGIARFRQYEYRANSNLVLTTENRSRDTHEPTGEPESLTGRISNNSRFGDRFQRTRPSDKIERMRKKKQVKKYVPKKNDWEGSVLSVRIDENIYKPKTKETRIAYEQLLTVIQQSLGDQPQEILHGAADEILSVLKNERLKDLEKKKRNRPTPKCHGF